MSSTKRDELVYVPKPIDGVPQCSLLQNEMTDVAGRWRVHDVKFLLNREAYEKDSDESALHRLCRKFITAAPGNVTHVSLDLTDDPENTIRWKSNFFGRSPNFILKDVDVQDFTVDFILAKNRSERTGRKLWPVEPKDRCGSCHELKLRKCSG